MPATLLSPVTVETQTTYRKCLIINETPGVTCAVVLREGYPSRTHDEWFSKVRSDLEARYGTIYNDVADYGLETLEDEIRENAAKGYAPETDNGFTQAHLDAFMVSANQFIAEFLNADLCPDWKQELFGGSEPSYAQLDSITEGITHLPEGWTWGKWI